jgi:hypothetical protein
MNRQVVSILFFLIASIWVTNAKAQDSLQLLLTNKIDTISSIKIPSRQLLKNPLDSLPTLELPKSQELINNPLDSVPELKFSKTQDLIQGKFDSIPTINLPAQKKVKNKLDSLSNIDLSTNKVFGNKADSLPNINIANPLDSIPGTKQVDQVKKSLESYTKKLSIDSLSGKTKKSIADNIPIDLKQAKKLDSLSKSLTRKLGGYSDSLKSKTTLKGLDDVTTDVGKSLKIDTKEIDKVKANLGDVKEISKLKKSKNKAGTLAGIAEKNVKGKKEKADIKAGQEYLDKGKLLGNDIKQLKKGNLDSLNTKQMAKEQLAKLKESELLKEQNKELQVLQKQQKEFEDQMAQYQDENYIQNQMKDQAIQLANTQTLIDPEKLKSIQTEVGKFKSTYDQLPNTDSLPNVPPNKMKGKPLRKRVIFGFYSQVHRYPNLVVDVSPHIAYRVSGIVNIGIGGMYRIDFGVDDKTLNADNQVYGGRVFTDIRLYKGFFAHVEVEELSANINATLKTDIVTREWVTSVNIGVGKRFKLEKNLRGFALALYNLNYQEKRTPYAMPFLLRFGVEGVLKAKRRK